MQYWTLKLSHNMPWHCLWSSSTTPSSFGFCLFKIRFPCSPCQCYWLLLSLYIAATPVSPPPPPQHGLQLRGLRMFDQHYLISPCLRLWGVTRSEPWYQSQTLFCCSNNKHFLKHSFYTFQMMSFQTNQIVAHVSFRKGVIQMIHAFLFYVFRSIWGFFYSHTW